MPGIRQDLWIGNRLFALFQCLWARQSLENKYAVVVPKFIISMLNNQPPPIHGDGRQARDFTYIDNVVQANILAAGAPQVSGEVFNVASGKDYSVLELVNQLNKIMSKELSPEFTPPRTGDVHRTLADISKAGKMLKFNIDVDFIEGLEKTVVWFKEHQHEYEP